MANFIYDMLRESLIARRDEMNQSINEHEGKKYLRCIRSAENEQMINVDVYAVLKAFNVEDQAVGHCIKKLLCAGQRGKGSYKDDLTGAMAALNRAIEMAPVSEDLNWEVVPDK